MAGQRTMSGLTGKLTGHIRSRSFWKKNFENVVYNSYIEIDIRVHTLLVTTSKIFSRLLVKQLLFSGLLVGCGKKSQISQDFQRQIHGKLADFMGILQKFLGLAMLKHNSVVKNGQFCGQISPEINQFCTDLTSVYCFFNRDNHFLF